MNQPTKSNAPPTSPATALLDRAREALPQLDKMREPATTLIGALDACLKLQLRAPPKLASALDRREDEIQIGSERAMTAQTTPDAAVAARDRYIVDARRAVRDRVARDMKEKGAALGEGAAQAAQAYDAKLQAYALASTDYSARRASPDLAKLLARERLASQIRARGAGELLARITAYRDAGDLDSVDELLDAGEDFIIEVYKSPRTKLHAKNRDASADNGFVDKEINAAIGLIGLMQRRREERVPPELRIARDLRDVTFVPAYALIVGITAWSMSSAKWQALLDGLGKAPETWELDPDWTARLLDGAPRWPKVGQAVALPARLST